MPNLLLVEDNELNRDMLSRRLRKRGYEIEIAVDGQEGLDRVKTARPDLILMDMSLPVIDGWEATRRLKSDPDDPRHPDHCANRARDGFGSREGPRGGL